jgi:hypothetical protein
MTILTLARTPSRNAAVLMTALAATVLSLLVGTSVSHPDVVRVTVALSVACLLIALSVSSPRLTLYSLVAWLVALGLVRRLLTTFGTSGPFGDPLLLVGPVLLLALFFIAVERGVLREHTRLSRAVLALTVVLALSAANPLQGGLTVGLSGALLVVVPMLAFWVGRSLLDEHAIGVLVRLLGALALLAAIYGLVQTFYGFPSWDQRWIAQSGYTALNVGGGIRAFGTSSSAAEYAAMLAVGILSWRALARRPSRLPVAVAAITVIATALWFESSRGIVVLTLAALWLTFAASRRMSIGRALLVGVALLAVLPTTVGYLSSSQSKKTQSEKTATSALVTHQVEGLSEPFGQNSTLGGHFEEVVNGIGQAVTNPVGRGVGATTIAATKFEGTSAGTEADPGNAPVAAGIIGLVLYMFVAIYGIGCSYRLAQARRTMPALAALGIIIVTFLQWLNGGQYAIIPLPWLFLGWVDATLLRSSSPAEVTTAANSQHDSSYGG